LAVSLPAFFESFAIADARHTLRRCRRAGFASALNKRYAGPDVHAFAADGRMLAQPLPWRVEHGAYVDVFVFDHIGEDARGVVLADAQRPFGEAITRHLLILGLKRPELAKACAAQYLMRWVIAGSLGPALIKEAGSDYNRS
jgi:hypothetical protein